VASATLAITLARKSSGQVNGFVVEGETAGGHNAPPRGPLQLSDKGEPVYGPRDVADLEKIRELGLPFWLAGSYATADKLTEALRLGAAGVQVGTAFAFCEESGVQTELKQQVFKLSREGKLTVFTDPLVSPTGFPFKVVQLPGTLSDPDTKSARNGFVISDFYDVLTANSMALSAIAARPNRWKILSAKAARRRKRSDANASAMGWWRRSACPR
jgi:nitronate monooxygenase